MTRISVSNPRPGVTRIEIALPKSSQKEPMSENIASVPGIDSILERTRRQIARGARMTCTYSYGRGINCLGKYACAWCTVCRMPRCEKHVIHDRCATCNSPVLTFDEIAKQTPHDTSLADGDTLMKAVRDAR